MTDTRGTRLHEFVAHGANVTCCTIGQKSGRVFATGAEDRKVNIWTVGNPTATLSLTGHTSAVEAVRFDGSEEMVVAGSASGSLKLYDLEQAKTVRTLTGHKSNIRSLDFHPYGEFIASGSMDTNLKVWDVRRRGCIQTYKGHTGPVECIAFSPDGRWVVSGAEDVKLWDLTAGKLLHEFKLHTGDITSLDFHPNEFLLATGSADRTVKFWDLETFNLVSSSPAEASRIRALSFHPDGMALFTGTQDFMHAYSWEPSSRLDAVSVGWGRVDAIHAVDASRLVGVSHFQTNVSQWVVDLEHVNMVPDEDGQIDSATFVPSTPYISNENEPPRASSRPAKPSSATVVVHDRKPLGQNLDDVTDPFARKPKLASEAAKDPVPTKTLRPASKPPASALAAAADKKDPPPNRPGTRNTRRDVPASRGRDAPPSRQTPASRGRDAPVKQSPASRGRNAPPPRKASTPSVRTTAPPSRGSSQPAEREPRRSQAPQRKPTVPSSRDRPFDLDVNAFLPAAASPSLRESETTDEEALAAIHSGNSSMMAVLNSRLRNIKIAKTHWENGNAKKSVEQLVELQDHAALIDVMNMLQKKPNLWSLDIAVSALPAFPGLLGSQYEHYVVTTCNAGLLICQSFTQLIIANYNRPSGFVDVTREERHEKCASAHASLKGCRSALQHHLKATGKIGGVARKFDQALAAFH